MAPLMNDDLDFVGTLSDHDEISDEEKTPPPQPAANGTKRKRDDGKKAASQNGAVKKQKKGTEQASTAATQKAKSERDGEEQEKDSDVDSEFEFGLEDGTADIDDFEGWAGNADAVGPSDKKMVDISAIVARRRGKVPGAEVEEEDDEDEDLSGDGGAELEEEEFDGFGAGATMEDDDDEGESGEEDQADSDGEGHDEEEDDEAAAALAAPDEDVSEAASDDDEDAVEEEKRNAFFAPEAKSSNPSTGEASFQTLSLSRPILKGLAEMRFTTPTPIQAKTIPVALEGKDVVGGAVTGSGKTAAFVIPILERLLFRPKRTATTRVAILMPTRELALQCFNVARKLASHTDITFGQAIGGLNSREQEKQLKQRPDIVVATPGRFIDLERNSTALTVSTIEILVLDEADRMLEEGFADELNEILAKIPKSRQTMLFSATMTSKVDDLIRVGLQRPVRIMVDAQRSTVSGLIQEFIRLRPGRDQKRLGYLLYLCTQVYHERTIIFFRQKKEAHRVRVIFALCDVQAAELHGSMSQQQRIDAIEAFRTGKARFLLATDLASRGLDIKGVDTVINYEAPQSHEIYLHRVGRTARAGRTGRACTLAAEPDRRVVKAAVKAAKAQNAQIKQRTIAPADADAWQEKIDALAEEVEEVLREEREEKALSSTERDLNRADNIVKHKDEILARPKKTWFESEAEKAAAKKKGFAALNNGETDGAAGGKREKKKLSNKQRKKMEDRDERKAGMEWKKGKTERGRKGAPPSSGNGKGKAGGGKKKPGKK